MNLIVQTSINTNLISATSPTAIDQPPYRLTCSLLVGYDWPLRPIFCKESPSQAQPGLQRTALISAAINSFTRAE
jgi:hypothetical protein